MDALRCTDFIDREPVEQVHAEQVAFTRRELAERGAERGAERFAITLLFELGLVTLGAHVLGLSSQTTAYQKEFADRVGLPYPLASDPLLTVAEAMRLPTFEVEGIGTLYKRLTFIAREGKIRKVFYPVFPPDANAGEVVEWLTQQR